MCFKTDTSDSGLSHTPVHTVSYHERCFFTWVDSGSKQCLEGVLMYCVNVGDDLLHE